MNVAQKENWTNDTKYSTLLHTEHYLAFHRSCCLSKDHVKLVILYCDQEWHNCGHTESVVQATSVYSEMPLTGLTTKPATPSAPSDSGQQLTLRERPRVSTDLALLLTLSYSLASCTSGFSQG